MYTSTGGKQSTHYCKWKWKLIHCECSSEAWVYSRSPKPGRRKISQVQIMCLKCSIIFLMFQTPLSSTRNFPFCFLHSRMGLPLCWLPAKTSTWRLQSSCWKLKQTVTWLAKWVSISIAMTQSETSVDYCIEWLHSPLWGKSVWKCRDGEHPFVSWCHSGFGRWGEVHCWNLHTLIEPQLQMIYMIHVQRVAH